MSQMIDSLGLEMFETGSTEVINSLTRMQNVLSAFPGIIQGSTKNTKTAAKKFKDLSAALDSFKDETSRVLARVANAVDRISKCKISSNIATQMTKIASAVPKLGSTAGGLSGITSLAGALGTFGTVKISSSIAKQIEAINLAINGFSMPAGFEQKIRQLADALYPISQLPTSKIGSYAKGLEKLPAALQAISQSQLDEMADKFKKLADAIKPFADEMAKVAAGFSAFPKKLQSLIAQTDRLANSNARASRSFTDLYFMAKSAYYSIRWVFNIAKSWVNESTTYVETLNLFGVTMRQYAEEAYNYALSVSEVMGIDPADWLANQGIFMSLTKGFGIVGDRAAVMSQQLTQLGYDLTSLYGETMGMTVSEAMQKLQSGISGELEPLRRLGYDLSQAKLEAVALSLGIDKSVTSMTQAEKAELRYYAIMTQITDAHGDMARTLEAPANQMRIFSAQITQLKRALGDILIPVINAALPYLIATVKVLRELINAFGQLIGLSMATVDWDALPDIGSDFSENIENGEEALKSLKGALLGFDEINILGDPVSEDVLGTGFDFELPTYDFISEGLSDKLDEITETLREWLGLTKEINNSFDLLGTKLGTILASVGGIGAGVLSWKLSNKFITLLKAISPKIASALGSITATATVSALSAGVASIIAGIPMLFTGIYNALMDGLDWLNALLIDAGATLAGAGIGAIIGAAGGPIGAGIGALIGLASGLYIDWVLFLTDNFDSIVGWVKDVANSIGDFFVNAWEKVYGFIEPLVSFVVEAVTKVSSVLTGIGTKVWSVLKDIGSWFGELFTSIGKTAGDIFYNIGAAAYGCWEVITKAFGIAYDFFDKYVFSPIGELASSAWDTLVSGARLAWDGVRSVFSNLAGFFKETFAHAWEGVVSVFKVGNAVFHDLTDAIVGAFRTVVNQLISGVNSLIALPFRAINTALMRIKDVNILGVMPFKWLQPINIPEIPKLDSGGVLNSGQLFIANERRPELVGNIGRRTAVANPDQIVEGISDGVASGNAEQVALLREQNSLLRRLLDKETTATAVVRTGALLDSLKLKNRRDGNTAVPVG